MGNDMANFLDNPIQYEEYGNRVYLIPRKYYGDQEGCQYIILKNGTMINILYDGVLPYTPVKRTTPEEIDKC